MSVEAELERARRRFEEFLARLHPAGARVDLGGPDRLPWPDSPGGYTVASCAVLRAFQAPGGGMAYDVLVGDRDGDQDQPGAALIVTTADPFEPTPAGGTAWPLLDGDGHRLDPPQFLLAHDPQPADAVRMAGRIGPMENTP